MSIKVWLNDGMSIVIVNEYKFLSYSVYNEWYNRAPATMYNKYMCIS